MYFLLHSVDWPSIIALTFISDEIHQLLTQRNLFNSMKTTCVPLFSFHPIKVTMCSTSSRACGSYPANRLPARTEKKTFRVVYCAGSSRSRTPWGWTKLRRPFWTHGWFFSFVLQCNPAFVRGTFGLKLENSTKLPYIHPRLHCDAYEKT